MHNVWAPQDAVASRTKRILVVETSAGDEKADHLMRDLCREQYQVTVASRPEQAMELVAAGFDYDMALIEIDLPRCSESMSLLKVLRREKPASPVIMYTDYGDDELWVDVVNEGASDLVSRCDLRRRMEEPF